MQIGARKRIGKRLLDDGLIRQRGDGRDDLSALDVTIEQHAGAALVHDMEDRHAA